MALAQQPVATPAEPLKKKVLAVRWGGIHQAGTALRAAEV
jgi:hypothetical protein